MNSSDQCQWLMKDETFWSAKFRQHLDRQSPCCVPTTDSDKDNPQQTTASARRHLSSFFQEHCRVAELLLLVLSSRFCCFSILFHLVGNNGENPNAPNSSGRIRKEHFFYWLFLFFHVPIHSIVLSFQIQEINSRCNTWRKTWIDPFQCISYIVLPLEPTNLK